jgi:hypothetical protein
MGQQQGMQIGSCKNRTVHMLSLFPPRSGRYRFVPGTTAVLTQEVKSLNLELLEETVQAMDVE